MAENTRRTPENKEEFSKFSQKPVVRVGLLLLTVLVIFAVVRHFSVPASFGQYGRYRGTSLNEAAAIEIKYAGGGNQTCQGCHSAEYQAVTRNVHRNMDCQTCHGPLAAHVKKPGGDLPLAESLTDLCSSCHRQIAGRDKSQITMVKTHIHSGGMECTRCHDPHQPREGIGGAEL